MRLIDVSVLKEWIENWFTKNRYYHPYAKNNNIPITELYDILEQLPSAQPERLTDDDFETIRIHLNAYKEKLCNQRRWEEAEEYQRIIDRFMALASAQPEIIRCKDCIHFQKVECVGGRYDGCDEWIDSDGYEMPVSEYEFCSRAERRAEKEEVTA